MTPVAHRFAIRFAPLALATAVVALPAAAAPAPPQFRLTVLADLPGGATVSQAQALNNLGVAGGQSVSAEGYVGAVWSPQGSATSLGDLPGGSVSGHVYGINDAGVAVGTGNGPNGLRGVIWKDGQMQEIADVPGGSNASGAWAINNQGIVVGYSYSQQSGSNPTAMIWAEGVGVEIGDIPGGSFSSVATGISDTGIVVGYSVGSQGNQAFSWTATGGMVALGGLDGSLAGRAYGVNDAGAVVGTVGTRAVRWQGGVAQALGDLAGGSDVGNAFDVNNAGWVVGTGNASGAQHAVLWRPGSSGPLDLNALLLDNPDQMILTDARVVNDHGQIAGWGLIGGQRFGYVLTPVPEPQTVALFAAGLGVVGLRWRRAGRRADR